MILFFALAATSISFIAFIISVEHGILFTFLVKPMIDATWQSSFGGFNALQVVGVLVPVMVLSHSIISGKKLSEVPLFGIWIVYLFYNFFTFSFRAIESDFVVFVELVFRLLNGFVGYYMIQTYFSDRESFRKLLFVILIAGLFPMLMGLYQSATGAVWHERQTVGLVRSVGVYHDAVAFRNYGFETLAAIILYWSYFVARRGDVVRKVLLIAYTGICLLVLYRIFSKAALLTLALWVFIWMVGYRRFALAALVAATTLVVAIMFQDQVVAEWEQLFSKEIAALSEGADDRTIKRTLAGRWYGWEALYNAYSERSLIFQIIGNGNPSNAHNEYLSKLLSGGVIGLAIYIVFLLSVGVKLLARYRQHRSPLSVMGLMIFAMWLVDTIGLVPSLYPAYQWYVWGFIGLAFKGVDWGDPSPSDRGYTRAMG